MRPGPYIKNEKEYRHEWCHHQINQKYPQCASGSGAYTQSVAFSHYNNIAAQLPSIPGRASWSAGDIQAQARQCLTNIQAIVQSIGHGMEGHGEGDPVPRRTSPTSMRSPPSIAAFFPTAFDPTVLAVASPPLAPGADGRPALQREGTFPRPLPAYQDRPKQRLRARRIRSPARASPSPTTNNIGAQLPSMPPLGRLVAGGIQRAGGPVPAQYQNVLRASTCPLTTSSR